MRLLIDSNVLLWALGDRRLLTVRVRELLDADAHELFVSHASLWELSVKLMKGRLPTPALSVRSFLAQISRLRIVLLPIEVDDILETEKLEHHHGDPFDRMIIAQAIRRNLTILSSDSTMPLYPIPVIWK